MLLNIKTRQTYLKTLGFYTGGIDGKEGPLTKKAYKLLQDKYFVRAKDKDGKYGPNTEILLKSAYNCKDAKNFDVTEFRCKCGGKYCTGYPVVVSKPLVDNLQIMRNKYKCSINIISALRCKYHNKAVGGSSTSNHLLGKSADIYITGYSNTHCGRVAIVDYWDTLANSKYAYCNGYMKYPGKKSTVYNSKTMGNSTHVNVK